LNPLDFLVKRAIVCSGLSGVKDRAMIPRLDFPQLCKNLRKKMRMDRWRDFLAALEPQVEPKEFRTWFAPARFAGELEDGGRTTWKIMVPNAVFADWIPSHHSGALREAAERIGLPDLTLFFEPAPRGLEVEAPFGPTPLTGLNPRYVFQNFVVGSSNQFAHAAARAVAEAPSRSYNPLFIYGGVGLGKTHLMQAIAHEILRQRPSSRVLYLSAEKFLNDLINGIKSERMPEFRRRYRELDVLLVDDVQFIAGKEATQEEFFHTFNALHESQSQIVLSSDAPPKEISSLEERLRSRFEWGLIADIQAPDLEMKVAILRKKAEEEGVAIPNDVALYIAGTVKSNIRELEGRINRVIAFASLTGSTITTELARDTLRDMVSTDERKASPAEILKAVAAHYGLRLSDIKAKSNAKTIAFPRQVAMYLCRHLTQLSFPEIGRLFNDKHHSTVMHSVEKIEKLYEDDQEFHRTLDQLVASFR
jgi:chromosomal replication initiator protein